jgi:hypothetical protein
MPGRMTAKGHRDIEYQLNLLKVFQAISVVCIEVELNVATPDAHLNAVAQLIAEADGLYLLLYKGLVLTSQYLLISTGCDYANSRLGFSASPIYGILSDGRFFEFYCFDSSTNPPTFSRCRYSSASSLAARRGYALLVANLSCYSTMDFVASLRPVCETVFYFLILGYMTRIRAQYQRSCSLEQNGTTRRQESTGWKNANLLAEQTMELALAATDHAVAGDYIKADEVAKDASERLKARLVLAFTELGGS